MAHSESDKMAKIATIVVSVSAEEHLARLETILKKTLDTVVYFCPTITLLIISPCLVLVFTILLTVQAIP